MELFTDPQVWVAFLTLLALELVLGVDNVVFISILAGKLPQEQRKRARTVGLALALVTRILLLFSLAWIVRLTAPLIHPFGHPLSGRDLILLVGGLFLILFGVFSPLSALISVIPASVIGATGLVVFAIVGTMGIDMLRKVDLRGHAAMYVVATALAVGLLPIVVPGIYDQLPSQLRLLLSNGVAMGALTAAVLNYLFIHVGQRSPKTAPLQQS